MSPISEFCLSALARWSSCVQPSQRKAEGNCGANRTVDRGRALADRFGAAAIRLEDVGERLAEFDIVVSCTASQLPIIGLGLVERAIKTRRHRPMFMVDLAVPRDVEIEIGELDDVFLYTVDDLAQVVESGIESRQSAVDEAETIVAARVDGFCSGCRRARPFQ